MPKALLIDDDPVHAERLIHRLTAQQIHVRRVNDSAEAEDELRHPMLPYDLVIVNVSNPDKPWITILAKLQGVCRRSGWGPLILCVSNRPREPRFELELERQGARYALEG